MTDPLARSLEHGDEAVGASQRREGFAFTPADDLAFALGWPHMITLCEDEDDPAETARALVMAYPQPYEREWPRMAAHRAARALAAGPTRTGSLSPEAEAALLEEAELSSAEASAFFRHYLGLRPHLWFLPSLGTHLFEALLGPSAALEIFVAMLEAHVDDWMQRHNTRCAFVNQLGYHLLRVPPAEADGFRERLEALFAHCADNCDLSKRHVNLALRELDLVLHGRAGVDRSAHHVDELIAPGSLLHLTDDADFVYEQARLVDVDASSMVEARLVFLAGERRLDDEAQRWRRYKRPKPGAAHARVVAHLGRIRSEKLLPLMLAMTAKSKAKKAASQWFVERADFARPWVEKTASAGGDEATWAIKVLKKMK